MPEAIIRWISKRHLVFRGLGRDQIYLTYDDGPHPEVTPRLLEILNQAGAKATFFVVASEIPTWVDLIRTLAAAGHTIGLHGYTHRSNLWRNNRSIMHDLTALAEKIQRAGVSPEQLWRPPYGHVRPDTVVYLKNHGIRTVLWSSMPGDYRQGVSLETLLYRIVRRWQPGEIITLHDGVSLQPAPVLELTKALLKEIRHRGWRASSLTNAIPF